MCHHNEAVVFEMTYGSFQRRYRRMCPILLIVGLAGVAVGIFWNEGWEMANRPVEPWAAAVMIESFAFVCLLAAGCCWYASKVNGKSPQRVVVTESKLIVPKGLFSRVEFTIPL